jgi:hypothetical protein
MKELLDKGSSVIVVSLFLSPLPLPLVAAALSSLSVFLCGQRQYYGFRNVPIEAAL